MEKTRTLEEKKPTKLEDISNKLDVLIDLLRPKDLQPGVVETKIESPIQVQPIPQAIQPSYPIPSEYRHCVNTVLNQDFGIQLIPMSDTPAFQFVIVVPQKYSPLSAEQRKMIGDDIRPKVITYAEGAAGVKKWVELVASTFGTETKVLIAQDRTI